MYDNLSRVIEVDINEILPNRFQPRIQFDEEEILELSDSIKEHGVIQPLVVRTIGDKYEIIAGERRYKASVLAGKETVPVIVKNLNDKDSAEIALIENIQRKNLTPIEEALSYKKILDMGYITQENLATKLGKSQSSVANKIRLLNLSDEVQEALLENKISERHARSLLKLSTSKDQNEMLNRIISERLTVRRTDEEIQKIKNDSTEESEDGSQKIIEKGEIEMNNNMFGIPNIPQNSQQPTPVMPSAPVAEPVPEVQSVPPMAPATPIETPAVETPSIPSFDIFGGTAPVIPSAPVAELVPEVQPVPPMPPVTPIETPVVETPSIPSFDIFGGTAPVMPSAPVAEPVPEVQPVPPMAPVTPIETPVMETPTIPNFDMFGGTSPVIPSASVPEVQPVEVPEISLPSTPEVPEFVVPQTAPIMESSIDSPTQMTQQSENLFSFGDTNVNSVEPVQPTIQPTQEVAPTIPEFKMPEPIIVTDYSKQYDPVMPITQETVTPTADFKEVIAAIRECSSKIEQYGFKIDVEEYDLANLYQVIFKIEK